MRFSAHRLRSEFPRPLSRRDLSHVSPSLSRPDRGTALLRGLFFYEPFLAVLLPFKVSTYERNVFGSRTAMSARTLRSRSTPAVRIADMRRLYEMPASREAALMRAIQRARNCALRARRSRKA